MKLETINVVDIEGLDEDSDYCIDSESICESIHCETESIHRETWFSAVETRHQLRLDKSPFQRGIAELVNVHQIPMSALRRGEARNTEYSQKAIALLKAMRAGDKETFNYLKLSICAVGGAAEVAVVAPVKFKENADRQLAVSDAKIQDLRQIAQLKLAQLQTLYSQWQEAEEAEKSAQEKDLDTRQAQWDLDCIDEVMREETYKKTRKREIKQMLKGE